MPLYEYVCQRCGRHFEVRQGFDGKPAAICPAGHHQVRRLWEPIPVHFRGSGFYATDNKKPDNGRTS